MPKHHDHSDRSKAAPPGSAPPDRFDSEALERLRQAGGDELVEELIELFLDDGPSLVEAIRDALGGEDFAAAEAAAHSLKSSAGTVGAVHLAALAGRLEEAAGKDRPTHLGDLLSEMGNELAEVRGRLAEINNEGG